MRIKHYTAVAWRRRASSTVWLSLDEWVFPHDQIKKEAEERDAMTRMSELYTKNPNLGDAAPLVHRLAENQKNLDGLQVELTKFQVFGIDFPGLWSRLQYLEVLRKLICEK